MGDDLDKVLGVVLGGYLLTVFSQGNVFVLMDMLKKEKGYLEFFLALVIVYYLVKYDKTGMITPLVTLSILGILLYYGSKTNLAGVSQRFADGELTLFGTIAAAIKGQ